ncbi:MAG TPA: helix-turn-helix transcriptional regulator [Pseudonocardia sp.]|nr:helix-turn-helix transcriptional regulator [Pseudonocardia sp.]
MRNGDTGVRNGDTGLRNGSVVRRRMLGRRLRALREQAGFSLETAAPRLDWSTSTLSRIETGQQAPDVHGVRSMLDLYDVGGERWEELITLTREARLRGWWKDYGVGEDTSYVAYETEASVVHEFALGCVPGLLQTADYARAVFAASTVQRTPDRIDNAVTVRMIRQERLVSAERPLEFHALVDEFVLTRPVGGQEVLDAQLAHLAEAARLPTVTLRIVPRTAMSVVLAKSGFSVLGFGDLGEPDIAYVEHALGALFVEREADVARARLILDRLRSEALSPGESLAMIGQVAGGT